VSQSKVTEGLLCFYGVAGRGFTLHTKNLMATFELGDTGSFPIPSNPYKAGDIIDISGNLAGGQTLRSGPCYYNGTSHPKLWYEGSFEFHAQPIAAPGNSSSPVAIRTPFKFKGSLRAYQSNNISGTGGPAVFDVALIGKGRATVNLGASYDVGGGTLGRAARAWLYYFSS
jgi:hypothetical protein